MTRLSYTLTDGYAELTESFYDSSDEIIFSFENQKNGTLLIEDRVLSLNNGLIKTDLGRLKDGTVTATLSLESGNYRLEPFVKEGNKILPSKTEDWVVRKLLKRVRIAEEQVKVLEEGLSELKEYICGYRIVGADD